MIILLSDVLNLKADSDTSAESTVLESHLDRSKGPVASILIQNGTLKVGDTIVFNSNLGKIRGMMNSLSENIKEAGPSSPVVIWGLSTLPLVGEKLLSFKNEKEGKAFVASMKNSLPSDISTLQSFPDSQLISGLEVRKKLNLIIKTDSQGSIEAINSILSKIDNLDVQLRILYSSPGEVTETDIEFAFTSSATVLAFNTTAASGAKKLAKGSSITIKEFDVVYDLFDYIQMLIDELVGPQYDEKLIGKVMVKSVFPLAKSFVAGSLILEGKVTSDSLIEVTRDNQVLYKGPVTSLKRLKENVNEVSSGLECGIFIDKFDVWKPGDSIDVFEKVPKKKIHSKI
jgi:translation initiation factor IF-2